MTLALPLFSDWHRRRGIPQNDGTAVSWVRQKRLSLAVVVNEDLPSFDPVPLYRTPSEGAFDAQSQSKQHHHELRAGRIG